jgi:hypothetical protein
MSDDGGSAVLKGIAEELGLLSAAAGNFEEVMSRALGGGAPSREMIIDAQMTDHLVQHLTQLAKFARLYLSSIQSGEGNAAARAIAEVTMSALAQRLAATCLGAESATLAPTEPELF